MFAAFLTVYCWCRIIIELKADRAMRSRIKHEDSSLVFVQITGISRVNSYHNNRFDFNLVMEWGLERFSSSNREYVSQNLTSLVVNIINNNGNAIPCILFPQWLPYAIQLIPVSMPIFNTTLEELILFEGKDASLVVGFKCCGFYRLWWFASRQRRIVTSWPQRKLKTEQRLLLQMKTDNAELNLPKLVLFPSAVTSSCKRDYPFHSIDSPSSWLAMRKSWHQNIASLIEWVRRNEDPLLNQFRE